MDKRDVIQYSLLAAVSNWLAMMCIGVLKQCGCYIPASPVCVALPAKSVIGTEPPGGRLVIEDIVYPLRHLCVEVGLDTARFCSVAASIELRGQWHDPV